MTDKTPRWGMAIDLDRCTGCEACCFACSSENNCPFSLPSETAKGVTVSWREMLGEVKGEFPHPENKIFPRPCMHCSKAPCVKACPVRATYKREDGITMQDPSRCIGCRMCMVACPYGVRTFNWFHSDERFPEPMDRTINPLSVPLRPKGTVEKCLFNFHRIDRFRRDLQDGKAPRFVMERLGNKYRPGETPSGEVWGEAVDILMRYFHNREVTPENFEPVSTAYLPACIQVCPAKAGVFGDLSNPNSLVFEWVKDHRATRLLEELGTEPAVYYLAEG